MTIDIILFSKSQIGRIFIDNVPFCFVRFDKGFNFNSSITKLEYKKNEFSKSFPFKTMSKGFVPCVYDIPLHFDKPNTLRLSYTLNFGWIYALRDFYHLTFCKDCIVTLIQL